MSHAHATRGPIFCVAVACSIDSRKMRIVSQKKEATKKEEQFGRVEQVRPTGVV